MKTLSITMFLDCQFIGYDPSNSILDLLVWCRSPQIDKVVSALVDHMPLERNKK